jgi:putative ABC transport system permease protein
MALNKRIVRVLLENKAQYLGSLVLILFCTFLFTLMVHFAMNFERLAGEFQTGYLQEDASFTTAQPLTGLAELEAAAGAVIEEGQSFDYPLAEGQTLRVFTEPQRLNLPGILEGKGLTESGEILTSPAFAGINNYQIGDTLNIYGRPFRVVGFMALPNQIYVLQSEMDMMAPPGFGIAVIGQGDFDALGQGSSFYSIKFSGTAESAQAQSVRFRELLQERGVEIRSWTAIENNRRVNIVNAEVQVLNIVSRAVPSAIMLLVIFLIGNVIRRMVQREAAVIGALYALGYTRPEITRHYLALPLLVAVVGGSIGTLLGTLPVRSALTFFLSYFNMPLTGIVLSPLVLAISLLLPILLLGLSGLLVTHKELRHSPVELMRGKAEQSKVNALEGALKLERLPFALKFQIREQLRSLSRLAFLLGGVAVATMLLMWGFALKTGFDYLLTNGVSSVYDFVYEYRFDTLRYDPLPAGAEPFAAALYLPVDDDKRDFYITGVLPDTAVLTLSDASGARLPTDGVIVTKALAGKLGARAGESVTVVRKLDGRAFTFTVDHIADTYAGNFIFMPLGDYNRVFEQPQGSYNGVFSNVVLELPPGQSYGVVSMEDKLAAVREAIAPTESMIGALATVAFIIGLMVISLVTSMIVEENKNAIALMKIFGYRQREINALILNSSTWVVVAGFLIGIPLTLSALGVVIQSMEDSVGLSIPPGMISPVYVLVGFVVVLVTYELSKLLSRKKVSAVPMGEALKAGME